MKRKRIAVALSDGQTAWLERLSPRQIVELSDSVWDASRRRLIQNMIDAEIESGDRVAQIIALDKTRGMFSELLKHAGTVGGSQEIKTKASTSKYAENATDIIDNMNIESEDVIRVACDLLGHELEEIGDENNPPKKAPTKRGKKRESSG